VDRVHESVDCASPVHREPAAIAALGSSASDRSSAQELRSRGRREEGSAGELNGGVAAAQEVVEGHLTSGETSARKGNGEGTVRAKREGVGGVGGFTGGGVGFYRAEARPSVFNGRR
jgi:hypothetical protein